MKGFITAVIIIFLVVGVVILASVLSDFKLGELYDLANEANDGEDFKEIKDAIDRLYPFLLAVSPDELMRELYVSLDECIVSDGGDAEKSRLLLAVSELRRQTGIHPASIF